LMDSCWSNTKKTIAGRAKAGIWSIEYADHLTTG
jgi:hypothetical protein